MEKCPICRTETNVSLNEDSIPEQYTCNSCEYTWDKSCMPDNVNTKEEHEEYLKAIGHEKHVKMLQHHYDTTIGLYAIDFNPKELLERFNNSQSDAHSIECTEWEDLLKDWDKWVGNKNINKCPFFQLK